MEDLIENTTYDKEKFRVIPGFRCYAINNDGTQILRVKKTKLQRKDFLTTQKHRVKGKEDYYLYATLNYHDAKENWHWPDHPCMKPIGVHRLVALAWCTNDNPEVKIWVNHIDGNKINNHFSNLEWCTISHNIQHAYNTGLKKIVTGIDHWRSGKTHLESTKKAMSEAKQGAKHPKYKGYYQTPLGQFPSSYAAAKAHNTNAKSIYNKCKVTKPEGYNFIPIT